MLPKDSKYLIGLSDLKENKKLKQSLNYVVCNVGRWLGGGGVLARVQRLSLGG